MSTGEKNNVYNMYLIKDIVSNSYAGEPFFQSNDILAVRSVLKMFTDMQNQEKQKYQGVEDFKSNVRVREFELWRVCSLNSFTFDVLDTQKQFICNCGDLESFMGEFYKSQGV